MNQTGSLENELKKAELLAGSQQDLTDDYGKLIKKLHSLSSLVVGLSSRVTKKDCIDILAVMRDLRCQDFPAFETKIRNLRDGRKKELKERKEKRPPHVTEKMKQNYNNNIKPKP